MIWLIIYVIGAAAMATSFLIMFCAPTILLKDLGASFLIGLFWPISVFFLIYTWWEDHQDDVVIDTRKWFKNEESEEN